MSIKYNGHSLSKIDYNGHKVIKGKYNGKIIYEGLPSAYQALEYVTANNSQYFFVNDLFLSNEHTVECKFNATDSSNLFGCFQSTTSDANFSIYLASSGGNYVRYNGQLERDWRLVTNVDTVVNMSSSGLIVDGVQDISFAPAIFTATNPFGVCNVSGSSSAKFKGKLYYIKVTKKVNNVVTRELYLVPAERIADNVRGLYDLEHRVFYTSQSSTPFA